MRKQVLKVVALFGVVSSFALSSFAFSKNYCVWVYCQNSHETIMTNVSGNPIVRSAEFAGPSVLKGDYFLNNSVFQELEEQCQKNGTPIQGGVLYGKNTSLGGVGFMWELKPANQANRSRPNNPPSIVANNPKCQAQEK